MHPHPLQLASARKLLQSCLIAPGPSAHALRLTRLSERRQRPPHMHLTGLPARPASSAGADGSARRSKLQGSHVCPCLADAHLLRRARSRTLPPSRPHTRLDCCCGGRWCPRHWPLGLAACTRCARLAPSLYHRPHRARTAVERRRRRVRCAPSTAGHSVCWACLPRARAALAA